MKPRTQKSMELYNTLLNRGFPQEFCEQISLNLNTDWTAQRHEWENTNAKWNEFLNQGFQKED